MITIHDCIQGSDEWHGLRQGLYTGSNAHKLLRYGAIEYALTAQDNFKGNFYTKRGHILEDEAIELYEAIYKRKVQRPGFITNSDFPGCGFSPDDLEDDAVGECKAFNPVKHMKIFNGDIPFEVQAQIHFGMAIADKPLGRLKIYNPDLEAKYAFKVIEIKRNRAIVDNFKRILSKVPAAL